MTRFATTAYSILVSKVKSSSVWWMKLIVACAIAPATSIATPVIYNANNYFLAMESGASPSASFGPFSIGYGPSAGAFTAFSPSFHGAMGGNTNIQGYYVNNPSFVPVVAVNVASTPTVIPNTFSTLAPGQILMHPGSIDTVNPNAGQIQNPVLRFTAPTTGNYSIAGDWERLHFGFTTGLVLINGAPAIPNTLGSAPINFSTFLNANDRVDFMLDPAGDISGDSTGLRVALTTNDGVAPPTCSGSQVLQGNSCVTPPLVCSPSQMLQGGVCVTLTCPSPSVLTAQGCYLKLPPYTPFLETPPDIMADAFIPNNVGGGAGGGTSLGATARRALDYYRANGDYQKMQDAYSACLNDTDCDPGEFDRQVKMGYAKFAADLGILGVELNSTLVGKSIGAAAVDMSGLNSIWDGTLLGKVKKFTDFVGDIGTSIKNGIDFFKSTSGSSAPALRSMATNAPLEPIIVNSVSGAFNWGTIGNENWQVADLTINVDIAKEYFQDLQIGQQFATLDSIFPGADSFGVFTVTDFVDPPGYNTVTLTLRQLDLNGTVPEPNILALFGAALGILALTGRRRQSNLTRPSVPV